MVGAVAADLDAQGGDLAKAVEGVFALRHPAGVRKRVGQPDVDAGRTRHTVAGYAHRSQRLQHRLFQPVDVLFHVVASPLQVHQRVGHHLAWAVVSHLPATVGGGHGNAPCSQNMFFFASEP